MEWQPIETAPKDERVVRLKQVGKHGEVEGWGYRAGDWIGGETLEVYEDIMEYAGGWVWHIFYPDGTTRDTCRKPTHWMPLPEPPK